MTKPFESFPKRFYIYQKERFPFLLNGLFLGAFAFSAISYSRICRGEEGFLDLKAYLVATFITITFFFLLRIADEFKDKEVDAEYRPYLPVPRGLISLKELKTVGIITIILQVLVTTIYYPSMLGLFFIPMIFLGLMTKEFFVPKWLKKHTFFYVTSHMFFFPAIDIFSSGMDWFIDGSGKAPFGLLFFIVVSYMNGVVYEFGRKIRAPENEEHHTYSAMYGYKKATLLLLLFLVIAYMFSLLASNYANYGWIGAGVLTLIFSISALPVLLFLRKRTVFLSKWMELATGGWGLFMYLTLGAMPMLLKIIIK